VKSIGLLWIAAFSAFGCQRPAEPQQHAEPAKPAVAPAASQTPMLAVGAPLPSVTAVAHNGETVTLGALQGKPVVVYFYPKDDTKGCTIEAQEIRDLWSEIQGTSAVVVGVSTDDQESHRAFAEKHALPFLLLPDTDQKITQAFGVPLRNGRASRVTFVFGRDGKLAKVFPEVKPSGHGAELLTTLKSLGS
jgi:thioredoxin-dependent peroxiredoxin